MTMPTDEGGYAPENPAMRRVLGLPLIVWVGIVAVAAYWWFSRKGSATSGTGGAVSYSGSGGTARSNTTIDKGAVQISVSQAQPTPPVRNRKKAIAVPDVRGMKYIQAAQKLNKAGLTAQRSSPYVGKVTRESPHSGTKVQKGSMVTLSGANKGNTNPWPGGKKKKDNDRSQS